MYLQFDNNNPSVWRLGSKENPVYIATTDFPFVQKFDIDSLETLELLKPVYGVNTISGLTHWQREVGTDNSLYLMGKNEDNGTFVELQRYKPENSNFSDPEIIAKIAVNRNSMVHSFSITKHYAIIFNYPVVLDTGVCIIENHFHGLECLKTLENEFTDIFIVNLKTEEVMKFATEPIFSIHHINAYETVESEIVVDLVTNDPMFLKEYSLMNNILNPPEFSNGSITMSNEIMRYSINLQTNSVTPSRFPNYILGPNRRYVNNFDLPTINENYRGREVCIYLLLEEGTYFFICLNAFKCINISISSIALFTGSARTTIQERHWSKRMYVMH